jgi:phosphoserine aminotransferase
MRVYNFSPGPATLPEEILCQVQAELLNYQNLGASVMEISHRSPEFEKLIVKIEADLRDLLTIPNNYKVLFLSGGGRMQFAMVPMNLLRGKKTADYINTGVWSKMASTEAARFCEVNVAGTSPDPETWQLNSNAAYVHYVANETIDGIEFPFIPETGQVPLVCDMSSSILSRPIDVSKFGLIYACAQKNIAPAGLTVVIIREDLIGNPIPTTPTMLNYKTHADNNSLYNTPPIFCWYMAGKMFAWLKQQGGLEIVAKHNQTKVTKLYQYIDQSDFYLNQVDKRYRSWMNVPFDSIKPELAGKFLQEAQQQGLYGLKGHPLGGGAFRASLYNAMPEAGG